MGLFTGRLVTSKCAFLIDKEIKLPSDCNGLTLARFDSTDEITIITSTNSIRDYF